MRTSICADCATPWWLQPTKDGWIRHWLLPYLIHFFKAQYQQQTTELCVAEMDFRNWLNPDIPDQGIGSLDLPRISNTTSCGKFTDLKT